MLWHALYRGMPHTAAWKQQALPSLGLKCSVNSIDADSKANRGRPPSPRYVRCYSSGRQSILQVVASIATEVAGKSLASSAMLQQNVECTTCILCILQRPLKPCIAWAGPCHFMAAARM